MKTSFNKEVTQKGFTLIELVVVIVILGILAVTAAPKFIDLTSDARSSVVQAVAGSLNSAADLSHAKALVNGTVSGTLDIAGETVTFAASYPDAASINLLMDIDTTTSNADFSVSSAGGVATYTHLSANTPASCVATYTETADANEKPAITSVTSGC